MVCCHPSNPLHITVRSSVRAFIPGQSIDLDIIANNRSNHVVYAFKVLLYKVSHKIMPSSSSISNRFDKYFLFHFGFQQVFYFIRSLNPKGVHQRTEVVFIKKQTKDGCDAKSYKDIHVDLKIPKLPPTDLSSSKIIKIKYLLRVSKMHFLPFSIIFSSIVLFLIPDR